jgi:hypothetical protein
VRPSVKAPVAAALGLGILAATAIGGPRDLPRPPRPDADFYRERIAPWVETKCAECHRVGGGSFRLESPMAGRTEEERRRLDFERVRAFVDPESPWDSRLIRKVLEPSEGGDEHVGGAFLHSEEEDYDALLDFASGATLGNLPPEVWLEGEPRGKPGQPVIVDGRGSFDRDRGDELVYRWELVAVPPGSRTALADASASRAEFVPDLGGSYVLRLRVGDGKVWSAARTVSVEVFEQVVAERGDPAAISGLEQAEPEALKALRRLYLDLLGRPPTPAEALADERIRYEVLVESLLSRAESGRAWFEEACERFGLVGAARPTGEEAEALPLRFASESVPPHLADAALVRSPAFVVAHPAGRAFAEAISRRVLDRDPTAAETDAAVALAAGGPVEVPGLGSVTSPAEWTARVLATEEFRRAAVRRRLSRFLPSGAVDRRQYEALTAAESGGAAWRTYLRDALLSVEYRERKTLRPKDDLTFLRSLFVDLLERKPTDRELAGLARAVAVLPGRSAPFAAVVKVLLDSGEAPLPLLVDIPDAPRWIADRFLRYLGRRPSAEEMKAFGEALLSPDGGPELVVRALLTGPEYACR